MLGIPPTLILIGSINGWFSQVFGKKQHQNLKQPSIYLLYIYTIYEIFACIYIYIYVYMVYDLYIYILGVAKTLARSVWICFFMYIYILNVWVAINQLDNFTMELPKLSQEADL